MPQIAEILMEYATGEWSMGEYTGSPMCPSHHEIAQLAFNYYESRGRQDGYHVEDWLRAEQELVHHYE